MGIKQIIPDALGGMAKRRGSNGDCDFTHFSTKGTPADLASGIDDYTQSFHRTFAADRDQAKVFMLGRMNEKKLAN